MRLSILIFVAILTFGCAGTKKEQATTGSAHMLYAEKYRPQVHFTPDSMWMNDPNGMVYYEGEYHLFYQYFPHSNVWGPMHWGHAVSTDMVHWEHLPIALYPDSLGYIFSGSAVVDWNNTSGLGKDGIPPLVAIFTYSDPVKEKEGRMDYQTQGIAYSLDKGRTWTKYEYNPVLNNPGILDFRDPKVRWYAPGKKWIMSLAVGDRISLYSSKDLKSWNHESDFQPKLGNYGGVWECPDLFPLTDKDSGEEKWILFVSINPGAPNGGSGTQYFVGSFDGHEFINQNKHLYWIDYGKDNYAGVTWSDIPDSDGRTLFMGWLSNWQYAQQVPTERWRSAMTVARELSLKPEGNDFIVTSMPVKELDVLKNDAVTTKKLNIEGSKTILDPIHVPFECTLEIENNGATEFGFSLQNKEGEEVVVSYNSAQQSLLIDRTNSGLTEFSEDFQTIQKCPFKAKSVVEFNIIVDKSSIEVFVDEGKRTMTSLVFPENEYETFHVFSKNGTVNLNKAVLHPLKSAWRN